MSLHNSNDCLNTNDSQPSPARARVSVLCQECGGDGYALTVVCCGKYRGEECGGVGCMGAVGKRVKCQVCAGKGLVE
jgi:hypothetical protein